MRQRPLQAASAAFVEVVSGRLTTLLAQVSLWGIRPSRTASGCRRRTGRRSASSGRPSRCRASRRSGPDRSVPGTAGILHLSSSPQFLRRMYQVRT